MDKVYEINQDFNFDEIILDNPNSVSGGSYFTKLYVSKGSKNLYMQLPKVLTKQGIIKNSNKVYTDLMFSSGNKEVISWFEELEKKCQDLIIQKKTLWFHNEVSDIDIDEMMNPIIRPYKSGKYFLVRTYLKGGTCNAYDENEKVYNLENLTNESEIIPLINIEGIRFNAKNIQIEITLTQLMVLIPPKEFENQCLIKLNKLNKSDNLEKKSNQFKNSDLNLENIEKKEDIVEKREFIKKDYLEEKSLENIDNLNQEEKTIFNNQRNQLEEVNLEIFENNNEKISLRDPNEVYKEIYLAAKKKAYDLRKNALNAYLEAQNIKEKYSFEDMDLSSEEEEEIEELNKLFKNNL